MTSTKVDASKTRRAVRSCSPSADDDDDGVETNVVFSTMTTTSNRSTPTKLVASSGASGGEAAKIPLNLVETDIVKMILEFLESRGLHIAQISLERESGIINGAYSSDELFLRQLIVDGNWDAALDFVEPLKELKEFDFARFKYLILKYKYFELLCIKNEPGYMYNNEFTVEELVECLQMLEPLCPNAEDYRYLCALLTLPKLGDHAQFARWNPSSARIECFNNIFPLVHQFLLDSNLPISGPNLSFLPAAKNERLIQLIIRGLLYENCVDLCQNKAVRSKDFDDKLLRNSVLLDPAHQLEPKVDGSLYSWLKCVPLEVFSLPFVKEFLDIKIDPMRRPQLDAQWTEQILATPIKPKMFPHSATPISRLKSAEKMSLSMIPQYEAIGFGPDRNDRTNDASRFNDYMNSSPRSNALLSQSIAVGFQLSGRNPNLMQQSAIDVLLESSPDTKASAGSRGPNSVVPLEEERNKENAGQLQPSPQMMQSSMYRSMTARQQLEDIKRKTLPANAQYMEPQQEIRRRVASENETPMHQASGKLYQEFNKQRINRGASEPPVLQNNESIAFQMMQMSFHAGRQNQASSYGMLPNNGYPSTPDNRILQPSSAGGGISSYGSYMASENVLSSNDMRTPQQQLNFTSESVPHTGIVAKRQIQQTFSGKKVNSQPQCSPPLNTSMSTSKSTGGATKNVKFLAVCRLEDQQAIRTTSFHPSGRYFAVGTNSRQLHVCRYPDVKALREESVTKAPEILLSRPKQHRGSVYCVGFNPTGELLATGSNDKTIRLMQFNAENCKIGAEFELTIHDGTIRDLVFMEDTTNRTSLLISGGAGNCKINITDCATGAKIRSMDGHTAPILGLYTWGGCMFVSCSQDKTTRFWDLRCADAVNTIFPNSKTSSSPVTSVCVDQGGRLLVSGHEDASILLYDIHGSRMLQAYHPHADQVRTVRFSPGTYYLLSGSYDKKIVITDMRGDLTGHLQYLPVGEHDDKIIQCRWHPYDFTFLSTSADRSVVLWSLPALSLAEENR